jgi:hypothetical protein
MFFLMKKWVQQILLGVFLSGQAWGLITLAQPQASNKIPSPPSQTTLRGVVDKIEMVPGQGPATLWMKNKSGENKQVVLGSIRYLVQKGFNLAVKDEVEVRGLETVQGNAKIILASQIQNLSRQQTLQLRDENFRPLWQGGPFGPGPRHP